ncbi:hypothetical protein B7494_g6638 [Chlorociboria aeruginascens]|nr:hypothetical protein B7494_g6638 [Chlorociboria aeruginascens]
MNAATLPAAPGQELQQLPRTYQPQPDKMQYEAPKAAASSDDTEQFSGTLVISVVVMRKIVVVWASASASSAALPFAKSFATFVRWSSSRMVLWWLVVDG